MANLCRCCHQPMQIVVQEAYFAGRPDITLATCKTSGCDLENATRELGAHDLMPDAEIASYAAANARLRARMEVYA